jgi:hypothetical protein
MTNFVYDHIVAFIEDVSAPSPSLQKIKGRLEFYMKYAVLPDIFFMTERAGTSFQKFSQKDASRNGVPEPFILSSM